MADELEITLTRKYTKGTGNAQDAIAKETFSDLISVAGSKRFSKRITITQASEVAVSLAEASASVGWFRVQNLDATNSVKVGPATGVYLHEPKPGEFCCGRLLSTLTNLYMRANVADVDVLLEVFSA